MLLYIVMLGSAIAMAGIFLVGLLLGEIAVDRIVFDGSSLWTLAQYDLGIALFEEIVSRSLQQNGVYILLGLISALVVTNSLGGTYTSRIDKVLVWCKWPAILAIAALFGWVHIRNPGASPVTAFGNALGGLMYGIAFFGGRNIWLPLGMHFAWNFFQGPIFGFSVSGLVRPSVIVQQGVGSDLLMGGAYGPEGGWWAWRSALWSLPWCSSTSMCAPGGVATWRALNSPSPSTTIHRVRPNLSSAANQRLQPPRHKALNQPNAPP
ncbi:MAG: CPBP family intramembrane metalloprotease [Anaerolineales bacterium]|nr:CPBP family intramembrane metalloprotease [Anaerolineales bacterium]